MVPCTFCSFKLLQRPTEVTTRGLLNCVSRTYLMVLSSTLNFTLSILDGIAHQ